MASSLTGTGNAGDWNGIYWLYPLSIKYTHCNILYNYKIETTCITSKLAKEEKWEW